MNRVGSTTILNLGSLVSFDQVLRRVTEKRQAADQRAPLHHPARMEPWKVWTPEPLNHYRFPARYRRSDGRAEGIVVGIRTLSNGPVEWGSYDEPTVFYPRETVEAVVVAWHLRRVPVLVLPDNLELIER